MALVNAREGAAYLDGVSKPSMVADHVMDSLSYGSNNPAPRGYKEGSARSQLYGKLMSEIEHTDKGSLYKVALPDEHIAKMLDWDKPLSQQTPEVQNLLEKLKKKSPISYSDMVDAQLGGPLMDQATGRDLYRSIQKASIHKEENPVDVPFSAIQQQASEFIGSAGIPGIKYLDQGSRAGGKGTSNYVVFDPAHMNILERNGVTVARKVAPQDEALRLAQQLAEENR